MKKIILILITLIFTLTIINGCENIVMDKTYCLADYDCACGSWASDGCAVGNKVYIDTSKQCPDFCTGIANNLVTKCVNNKCSLVQKDQKQNQEGICTKDEDCVAATCCHPKACVHISQKPDCSGIMCTQVCEPGTLDCGQGKCVCDDGVCKAVIVELL